MMCESVMWKWMANYCVNHIYIQTKIKEDIGSVFSGVNVIIQKNNKHTSLHINYGFRESYYKYCGISISICVVYIGFGGRQNDKKLFNKRGN